MDCVRCADHLIDYHYAELMPEDRQRVAEHLGRCGECATAYCRLDADLAGVSPAVATEPGPEVHARLRREVERQFAPPWWKRALRLGAVPIPAYQAALGIAAIFAVFMLIRDPMPPPTPTPVAANATSTRMAPAALGRPAAVIVNGYDASTIVARDPNLF